MATETQEKAEAFIDWVVDGGVSVCDSGLNDVSEVLDQDMVVLLKFHLLSIDVLNLGDYVGLEIKEEIDGYEWSYNFEVRFLYGDYTMKLLEMHPSSIISMVIDKIPFTEYDKIEEEDGGAGCSCNPEENRSFEEFLDEDIHMDRIFPVLSGTQYYFLNVAQKAAFDRLVTAYTTLAHWSEGRKRVRDSTAPIPGNNILRIVEGLPRAAIAEIYLQLNTPSVVTRGGAGGE